MPPPPASAGNVAVVLTGKQNTLRLAGRIVDPDDTPLSGAEVRVRGDTTFDTVAIAGAWETYLIFPPNKTSASFEIETSYDNDTFSEKQEVTVALAPGSFTNHVEELVVAGRRVVARGQVQPDLLLGVSQISFTRADGSAWYVTESDTEGYFRCPDALLLSDSIQSTDDFTFTATVSGTWGSTTRDYVVRGDDLPPVGEGGSVVLTLQARPTVLFLTGSVKTPDNLSLPGASITITGTDSTTTTTANDGTYGAFLILPQTANSASLTITASYAGNSITKTLTAALTPAALTQRTSAITLQAPRNLALQGNVRHAENPAMLLGGARIYLHAPDTGVWCETTAAANGAYTCPNVATLAGMNYPSGVAVASDGSVYIADTNNHRIRKVAPNGIITTVAGTGTAGYFGDSGQATSARLNHPQGIAVGSDGSLYIADTNNHRIRMVWPNGIITTIAGTGVNGSSGDDGLATEAQVNGPADVALDQQGRVLIVDSVNHRVRRLEMQLRPLAEPSSWSNTDSVNINSYGTADTYPSEIEVSGVSGTLSNVRVTLHGLSHDNSNDLAILLQAPDGQTTMLMSYVGSWGSISELDLTFDDAADELIGGDYGNNTLYSGTFRPHNAGPWYDEYLEEPAPTPTSSRMAPACRKWRQAIRMRRGDYSSMTPMRATAACLRAAGRSNSTAMAVLAMLRLLLWGTLWAGVWMLRSAVQSGYPLFPSAGGALPVEWRVPEVAANNEVAYIRGWARDPGAPYRRVLESWNWLLPWCGRMLTEPMVLLPLLLGMSGGILLLVRRPRTMPAAWVLLPPLVSLIFWFVAAPDPRFAGASFWVLAAGVLMLALHAVPRRALAGAASLVLIIGVMVAMRAGTLLVPPPPEGGRYTLPTVPVREQTNRHGTTILVPRTGDQCWDAALPCAPILRNGLVQRGATFADGYRFDTP